MSNIDPLIGADARSFQVNSIDINDTSFAPPKSELQFQGGFGDFNGDDVALEIKDTDGNVVETFTLTGEGQAEVYRDEEYEYIFFSDTNETTNVDISSKSNIKFGNYIGDSLNIETTGTIEGENVQLFGETVEEPGLILESSLSGDPETLSYNVVNLGVLPNHESSIALDINNSGKIVGYSYSARGKLYFNDGALNYVFQHQNAFLYQDSEIIELLPGLNNSSKANAINESGKVVGYVGDLYGSKAFSYVNNSLKTLNTFPDSKGGGGKENVAYGINDLGQIVGNSSKNETNSPDSIYFRSAVSHTNGLIKELGSLIPDDDYVYSIAFDNNNFGQIVGISCGRPFIYKGGIISELAALPGYSGGGAMAINNYGQIAGFSGNSSNTHAVLYNNGQIQDLGVLPETSQSFALDINNSGQVVGTSGDYNILTNQSDGKAFLYDNNELIDLNNLIASNSGWELKSAQAINNRGQIVGGGILNGQKRAFLLEPILIGSQDDAITIGNITTFGDTVLLKGGEITLTGEAITTEGGSITFDGQTTVNRNLTIDSSIADDATAGGNITFKNTLNADSAGSKNLTLKAGTGNILFEDRVNGDASFLNIAVEGAGTVTINKNLAVDGNLSLEVINSITTADLSAAGLVNISLGKVGDNTFASTGNVATGNINALSLEVLNNGSFTSGSIVTTDGDINIISLNSLALGQLTAINGAVDLISGTAGINVNGTIEGDNGFIALAKQNIVTNEITSSQDAVILKSSQGAVTVNGAVTAYDDISLAAANNVTVGAVTSQDSGVALISATGIVTSNGAIFGMEDVTVASAQSLTINQEIKAELGSIALASTKGSVTMNMAIGTALDVNIAAKENVSTKAIQTYGGNIFVKAERGRAIIGGVINSRGGDVSISAWGMVTTKNIVSKGGDVVAISNFELVRTGYIRTDGGSRNGGVYLQAGGNIKVIAAVDINGTQYSIYAGNDGVIAIASQRNKIETKRAEFIIGSITGSGTLAKVSSPVISPTTTTPGGGTPSPNRLLIYIEIFKRILDAGGTAPAHVDEINPITGQRYGDVAEFEFTKKFTTSQERKLRQYINDGRYKLEFEYVKQRGKFDDQDRGCFGLQLTIHLGGNAYHDQYAEDVTNSPGDFLILPPAPVDGYAFMFYDGIVLSGSKATLASPSQNIGNLAEVKTGYEGFNYIANGNPRPERIGQNGQKIKSDLQLYNEVVDEIIREGLIAKFCHKDYFVSFDRKAVADNARLLLNSDSRILASGLSNIEIVHIKSRPLIRF